MPRERPRVMYLQPSTQRLIDMLTSHTVNTLTQLVRIERTAATTSSRREAEALQSPIRAAWVYYVNSGQLTTELCNLTPRYPFSGALVEEANRRVRQDPSSSRSWNLAWLVLTKIREGGLIAVYAREEALKPGMWDGRRLGNENDVARLAACFEEEWNAAVVRMLRHWERPPTWF
ncbi:hypothetical protein E4U21_000266 [Claviceps maximensis]|nr:hypothetical protein E4U21_000266 [Claviceps maximensis]